MGNILQNIEQVVSAMVQVMNDDVRRKFGFGVRNR